MFGSQPQGMNLGTAHGKVIISTNVAEAMQQAQNSIRSGVQNIGASIQGMGNNIASIGSGITAWTAPITAVGLSGLKTFADFEDVMAQISARTGLTGEALKKLEDEALSLGSSTLFSGTEAAQGMLTLLTAGLDTEQALQVLPNVLNAAQASGEGLEATADRVTGVMAAFGLEASDTTDIVNAMAQASGASKAGLGDIGDAMARAGGFARAYGITMEDTAAIMAIFAQSNLRGTDAGTALRSMLNMMNSPTERAADAWASLGTSMFDAQGNMRNLDDIMKDVRVGLSKMSDEQRTQTITAIAGAEGMQAFTALLNSDGIEAMTQKMSEQATVAEMAAAMMGTLKGVIDDLGGSVESLMVEALKPFVEDTLKPLILYVKDTINRVTDWVKANPVLAQTIVKVLAALSALGPVLFVAGKAIALIGIAITALTSPIGLVVAGLAALAVAFKKDFGGIRTFVTPILNQVWEGINQIREAISFFVSDIQHFGLAEAIKGIFGTGSTGETQQSSLEGILVAFGMSRENAIAIVDFIVNTFNSIRDTVSGVIETLRPLFAEIGEFLGNLFTNVDLEQLFQIGRTLLSLTNPIGIAMTALQALGVDIGQIFRDGVAAATRFFDALNNGGTVFDGLRAAFGESSFIDGLETGFNNLITFVNTVVLPGLQALANWFLVDALPKVKSFVETTIIPAIETFVGVLQKIWNDVSPFLQSLFNWFVFTGLPIIVGIVKGFVQPAIEGFISILSGIWEAVSPALRDLYDWFITTGLPKIKTFIEGPVTNALTGIRDLLAGLWTFLQPHLETLKTKLKEVFDFIRLNVLQPVLTVLEKIIDTVGTALDSLGKITGNAGAILEASPEQLGQVDFLGAIKYGLGIRDNGGPGVAGMPYLIRPKASPEVFIPSTNGQFIPNFDRFLQQNQQGGEGDVNIYGGITVQGASSYEAGMAAGRGVGDGVRERLRSRGR